MSFSADLGIRIGAVFNGARAFGKADASVAKLNKSVKALGVGLGVSFGAAKLGAYSKQAVKAFAADDKAARVLTKSLQNLGLGFQSTGVAEFIASLEKTYGIMDDQLRPAFQKLLTTTGSVSVAQASMKTALDLSAASGVDVVSVADDLAKAYVGQTRGLTKYGLGLSQVELKAMSYIEVQKTINDLFRGQAALAADTYSGKIDKLSVAAKTASEIIGQGLVEALGKLGGGGANGIDNATKSMTDLAGAISGVVNTLADVFQGVFHPIEYLKSSGIISMGAGDQATQRAQAMAAFYANKKITDAKKLSDAKAAAAAAKAAALAKAAAAKLVKDKRDALKLSQTAQIFELDKIQIVAALQGKISAEERTRLELQMALLTGNADEATRLTNKLAETEGKSKELSNWLKSLPDAKNPFEAWQTYLDGIEATVKRIAGKGVGGGDGGGSTTPTDFGFGSYAGLDMTKVGAAGIPQYQIDRMLNGGGATTPSNGGGGYPQIQLYIDGAEIAARMTIAQQNQSLSGTQSFVDRKLGGW